VALVDDGSVPDGVRLPTERALAAALGVSRTTATAGYRHAQQAGRVVSRQGSARWTRRPPGLPRPAPVTAGALGMLGRRLDGVIDLSLAETRCARHTRAVLAELDRSDPGWLTPAVTGTGYHPQGLPALREALAGRLPAAGVPAPDLDARADGVLITTGAQQAIALSATVLAPPGSAVLVEQASYPGALEAFRRLGLRPLPVPTDAHGPDPRALASAIARVRPALVYLVPVGNNPTGVVVPAARLDALAEVLARTGVSVIEDRTAEPLADPAGVPAPLAARMPAGTVVVVGSMSKVAWAGLRVGWAVAPPAVLRDLLAARVSADLSSSVAAQAVALALLPELDRLAAAVRADLRVRQAALRTALAAALPDWSGPEPDAGAWRWLRIPGDARALAGAAASEGVVIAPGPAFAAQGGLTDWVRLAAVEPPEVLAEAVRRLARAWDRVARTAPGRPAVHDLLLI
jgi:DNA-binding transcriptional MocR family regulator